MFAMFGPVIMGLDPLTMPTGLSETLGNTFAHHEVIRGKPVLQDIGRELDTRELNFFFDETFCDPEAQWAMLMACYLAKEALPLISGNAFDGRRFVVESLSREVEKTTRRSGRIVRIEATMCIIEAPVPSLLDALMGAASGAASAVSSSNPATRK